MEAVMLKASSYSSAGKSISYISSKFLGTSYKDSTLIGSLSDPEEFVINLQEVDCFTFIEYVEALRLSISFKDFEKHLKEIRYRSAAIDFRARNHLFTDWREFNKDFVDDVTMETGGGKSLLLTKKMNVREDGTFLIEGIAPCERDIAFIPSADLTDTIIDSLKTGDYIGIYSATPGLDVTHVGILIKYREKTYLRHASSKKKYRKVIDEDFKSYMSGKPGIIVLRPKKR